MVGVATFIRIPEDGGPISGTVERAILRSLGYNNDNEIIPNSIFSDHLPDTHVTDLDIAMLRYIYRDKTIRKFIK